MVEEEDKTNTAQRVREGRDKEGGGQGKVKGDQEKEGGQRDKKEKEATQRRNEGIRR